jgi:hypothetical protein
MKRNLLLYLGILALLVIAIGAYFWVSGMMGSMFAYRSPLAENPPAPGEALGAPITRKVVYVMIDALRLDTSLEPEVMPFLNELRQQAAFATMHSLPPSFSNPGWTALMTGAWPDLNDSDPLNPSTVARTFTQDDIFAAAQRAGLSTAVSGYDWLKQMLANSGVVDGFYVGSGYSPDVDRQAVDAALRMLENDHQLIFIDIDQVDYAGHHQGGPRDPRWNAAATGADGLLREIVSKLNLEQDTVIVVADHGQIDRGGHGGQDPVTLIEPFVMAGAGVKTGAYPDIQMVDAAPTIAALLGTSLPASSQGHVLTGMLNLSEEQRASIYDATASQQQNLYNNYVMAIGGSPTKVLVGQGADVVDTYQQAMSQARAARLLRERIWRGLLALLLAAIPAVLLFLKRNRQIAWLLGSALLYALLFNLRYAVLDGRTYSLSSLDSEADIIIFCSTTAAIALLIAWLVAMFGSKSFRLGARHAAETGMAVILTTIYILSLPLLLSYTLNGAVVNWTLPDASGMLIMFLGFISLIQGLMVAVIGLLLVGVSALVGRFARL